MSSIPKNLSYTSPEFNLLTLEDPENIELWSSIFTPGQPQSPISSGSNRIYTPLNESSPIRVPSDDFYYSDDEIYRGEPGDYASAADRTESVFQIAQGKFDEFLNSLPLERQEEVIKFIRKDQPQSHENNDQLISDLESLLFFAVNCNSSSMIRLVLNHKVVNIHAKDENGDTALHKAVSRQFEQVIQTLLLYGASDRLPNDRGITPCDLAQVAEFDEFLDIKAEVREWKASASSEDLTFTI